MYKNVSATLQIYNGNKNINRILYMQNKDNFLQEKTVFYDFHRVEKLLKNKPQIILLKCKYIESNK